MTLFEFQTVIQEAALAHGDIEVVLIADDHSGAVTIQELEAAPATVDNRTVFALISANLDGNTTQLQ